MLKQGKLNISTTFQQASAHQSRQPEKLTIPETATIPGTLDWPNGSDHLTAGVIFPFQYAPFGGLGASLGSVAILPVE